MSIGAGSLQSDFPYGFNNGALVRGVPIQPTTPGKVLWVYNGTQLAPQGAGGSDGNDGSFGRPKATIAGALLQCAAGRGDIIYVKPGHAETINSATYLALNIAGVQVIGMGNGASRPTLTFSTTTAATIAVSAAGCSLVNFNIDATGFASLAAAVTVTAADFAMQGCFMKLAGTNQAVLGVSATAAANGLTLDSNLFIATAAAGTTAAIQLVGGDSCLVTNNYMEGQFGAAVGAVSNITTATTNTLVKGNVINNSTAASTKAVTMQATSTGQIVDNRVTLVTPAAPFTAAAMGWASNYSGAVGASAVLV